MACEKYSRRVTDAVLGALSASEHAELIAHLGACDACRVAYRRSAEVAAMVDRGVGSLVDGAPSAAFAARLRARLAEDAVRVRRARGTRIAATAGGFALAAALLAAIHIVRGSHPVPAIAWKMPPPVPAETDSVRGTDDSSLTRPHLRRAVNARAAHENEPAVLIDPSQLVAVEEFAGALAVGHLDGKELVSELKKAERPLEIENLSIRPLNSSADTVAPDDNQGGF